MNAMMKTIVQGLSHGIFVGATGDRSRLTAMIAEMKEIQQQLSLSETPALSNKPKPSKTA